MQSVVPKSESKKEIPEKAMTEDYQYEYIDKLDVGSINYKSIKQNIKIEMSLSKNNKHIRLRWFTAFWKPNKPRAQKGLARKVLCEILLDLVKKKKITKDYTFDLMAANINVKGMNYDPKKQEQMYHSLGFKTTAYARIMKQTVGEFVEKCERDILND